jgi:signal transduction histidine kinase
MTRSKSRSPRSRRAAIDNARLYDDLERRVRQRTAELEAVNRELDAFSHSVAHDLRAPLCSIDGFGQALLEDYADKLDDEGRKYLGRVRESAQHMARLIDDLLALSRVSRSELRRRRVDLSALVWRPCSASSSAMADECGPKRRWGRGTTLYFTLEGEPRS